MLGLQQLSKKGQERGAAAHASNRQTLTAPLGANRWEKLTLRFAEVQGMVGHGHAESLPGIDVSSRVVVALGVSHIGAVLCRCDSGEEQEEDRAAKRTDKLLPRTTVGEKLHCADPVRARSH